MFTDTQTKKLKQAIRFNNRFNRPMTALEEMNIIQRAKKYGTVKAVRVFQKQGVSLFYVEYGTSHLVYIRQRNGVNAAMLRESKRKAIATYKHYEKMFTE